MASNGSGDSADSVRVYTTDTIVDHPGAEIVYKGFITFNQSDVGACVMQRMLQAYNPLYENGSLINLTEEAKERAKKLSANAIVGVKIMVDGNSKYTFIGTAVRFFRCSSPRSERVRRQINPRGRSGCGKNTIKLE